MSTTVSSAESVPQDRPAGRRYCLITPARDEAKYARRTLDSVVLQSIRPNLWVIVDDGSRDDTPQIRAEYAAAHDWIRVVRRDDRGHRALGGGVIDAFYAGYDTVESEKYDYVCKIDLDLVLPPKYFEGLILRMEDNPRIGTCSGKPYMDLSGRLVSEMCGDDNSVGMIKFYRTRCFRQIGGFVRELMWDGIDGHRCRMYGWLAVSWDDPDLRFVHLRPMGTSDKSWWTGRVRHGVGQYYMGTMTAYFIASVVYRMTRPPVGVGGIAMMWGYLRSALSGAGQYPDHSFRRFLHSYQWRCLMVGKPRALSELNEKQASVWAK